ncbi:MAG: inositol monophosphatase family protein [Reichenbachiella sp.]|uniref:inositol monophosphatase family protein n=1 Tax=Reichenbachiella sp. TaxID=2184521 RepID=UPI0032675074
MKLSEKHLLELSQVAENAARSASAYIKSQADSTHKTNFKSGIESLATQVVTEIDIESQRLILEHLESSIKTFDLGLLTEEAQDDRSRLVKDYFWCIDPLDGTLPYTEQQPGYAVSIALVSRSGIPVIGVVADPYRDTIYAAIKGKGCTLNGKALVLKPKDQDSLVCHFDRSFLDSSSYQPIIEALESILTHKGLKALNVRSGAGAVMNALGLCDSHIGCYIKLPKANPGGGCIWDFAATSLIYSELGLHVSDAYGNVLALNRSESPYMNQHGVIYATDLTLGQEIVKAVSELTKSS